MRFVILTLLLLSPRIGAAQVVRGRVLDENTDRPVSVASLELLNERNEVLTRAATDSAGAFRLRAWRAGSYRIRTSSVGYVSVTSDTLHLQAAEEVQLEVRLNADAVPMEPLRVVARARKTLTQVALAGYYDRRDFGKRIGAGVFLDRPELEQRGSKLTDVLRRVPGVRVIMVRSCVIIAVAANPGGTNSLSAEHAQRDCPGAPASICAASLYLDGQQLQYDPRISIDQIVPFEWVAAIEVYRRPAELPAEFLTSGACGVVAIWTRREATSPTALRPLQSSSFDWSGKRATVDGIT